VSKQRTTNRRHYCVSGPVTTDGYGRVSVPASCVLCPAEDREDRATAREAAVDATLSRPLHMWSDAQRREVYASGRAAFTVVKKWSPRQRGMAATATVRAVVATATHKGGWSVEKRAERLQAARGGLLTLKQAEDCAASAARAMNGPRRQRA
jgi:hypothetical protein